MKAQDLKIGNWVQFRHTETPVLITLGDFVREYKEEHLEDYEPIPLTEEWLERFGFETECKWINDCRAVKGDFYITLDHDGATVIGYPTSVGMRNKWMFVQDIEYVHKLQNLYFALTGQELQTDETKKKVK